MKTTNTIKNFAMRFVAILAVVLLAGNAWGTTGTLDFTTSQTSPVVNNNVTFTWSSSYIITGAATAEANGFGGKNGTADMVITIPSGTKLTGISKVNGNNWGATDINVYVGTNSGGTKVVSIEQGTDSYTISSNNTGTTYYLVNSASKNAWIQSLSIEYTAATPQTVNFNAHGGTCGTTSLTGVEITLPAASPTDACVDEGWAFYGWATGEVSNSTTDAPTIVGKAGDKYYPASTTTLHAVYHQITDNTNTAIFNASTLSGLTKESDYNYSPMQYKHSASGIILYIDYYGIYQNTWDFDDNSGSSWGYIQSPDNIKSISISYSGSTKLDHVDQDAGTATLSTNKETINCTGDVKKVYLYPPSGEEAQVSIFTVISNITNYFSNPSCCANEISLSAGTQTHATITSITPSSFATCGNDASRIVTIVATANTGYEFKSGATLTYDGAGTATKLSDENGTWTYRISQDANGSGTFDVTATAKKYTVTLDDNGGSAGSGDVEVTYDGATSAVDVPELLHSYFGGYWTSNDGGTTLGTQIIDESGAWKSVSGYTDSNKKWVHDGDVTLYAKWTAYSYTNYRTSCVDIYTVTYDANDGTGSVPVDETEYDNGTHNTVTVLDKPNNLAKENYTFAGWNTKANGTGETYTAGQTFEISKNTTLYAKWDCARAVTISKGTPVNGTFELSNTGAIATCDDAVTVNVTNIVPATGYHFGEVTSTIGSVENTTVTFAQYANGSSTINVTFVGNDYTVTLNKQGGTGGGDASITATFGSDMPTLSAKPGKSGYTFQGYYGSPNGEGTQYYNADKTSANVWDQATNEASIYAYWTPNQTTITLNNEGASTAGTTEVVATYDAAPTAITVPEKTDRVFGGYWTEANGTGSQLIDAEGNWIANVDGYTGTEKVWKLNAATLELHAFWKQSYTLTFSAGAVDATGDAPSLDGTSVLSGDLVTLPANTYSRDADYYRFSEWAVEDENGDPVAVTEGKFTMPASNVTITAQWWDVPELARTYTSNVVEMTVVSNGANEHVAVGGSSYDASKAGTGKNQGTITVTVPAGSSALHFHAVAWSGKTATLSISGVTNASQTSFELVADAGAANSGPYALTGDPIGEHYFYFTFDQVDVATTITFTRSSGSDYRFIIYGANAVYPEIKLNPTEFNYGTVRSSDTKSQVFEITTLNGVTGTLEASITDDAGNNYSVSPITDGKVTVTFDPKGAESGTFTAKLRVAADNAYKTADLTATAIPATQPEITVDRNAIDFGYVELNTAANETVVVQLAYIDEEGVTATLSGDDADKFALSTAELTSDGDLVISKNTNVLGIYSANLTLSATGADDVVIPLTMKVANKWAVTYTSNVTMSEGTNGTASKVMVNGESTQYDAIKAGTGDAGGSVIITVPAKTQKLHVHAAAWKDESVSVSISGASTDPSALSLANDDGITSGTPYTLENSPISHYFEISIPDSETPTTLTFSTSGSKKRFVIYGVNEEGGIHVLPEETTNASTLPAEINLLVENGKTLNVDAAKSLNNLTVEAGGKVDLSAGKALTVDNFYIEGQDYKSGQVFNAENLTINGEAYFDFTLAVSGTTAANQWHNFSVPFPVDAMSGVYGWKEGEWKKLTNEVDYAIEYYHGDLRANGDYGWKKFRGTMTPGHTYSMTVNGDIQTYRFKKSGNDAFAETPTVAFSQHSSSDSKNAGWNGLGNMRLCYSSISNDNIAETTLPGQSSAGRYVLVLDAESYNYVAYLLTNINLTVGSAFFIQASADGTMGFNEAQNGAGKIYAPARIQGKIAEPIMVTMSGERGSDHMYISADEDATSTYQIGRDMQRMFASSNPTTPLIYTMNYGNLKLAAEDAPLVNDQAVYTLQLYAPVAGEYTLQTEAVADADVYLTYEGAIIWNISESEYTVDLGKGKNDGYGLKLVKKAPAVVTGVDQIDAKADVQKVIIDEHVYILRGGQMYDVNGKMVK